MDRLVLITVASKIHGERNLRWIFFHLDLYWKRSTMQPSQPKANYSLVRNITKKSHKDTKSSITNSFDLQNTIHVHLVLLHLPLLNLAALIIGNHEYKLIEQNINLISP